MARARSREAERARGYDRNAIARSLGFRNEYDMRIRGGIGAARRKEITPETPKPSGAELRRARGHAGVSDLLRDFQPGSNVRIAVNLRQIETDDAGDFVEIPLIITTPDGDEREYFLRDIDMDELDYLIDELDDMDADYDEDYDLQALVSR